MIDPNVRPAAAADVDQLEFLEREARDRLVGQRGGDRWLATHERRGQGWRDDIDRTLVAHIGEVLVGYIVVTGPADRATSDPSSSALASIDEVYVTSEARELGFGDALLDAAIERARSHGATLLEGEALPGDRDTKNLYERAGIKARLITVSAPI